MAQLTQQLNAVQLWSIAVGMVISGQFFGWNYGLAGGWWGLAIAAAVVSLFYFCFMLTYAELAVAMPTAAGPMMYAQKALGPVFGYAIGFACLCEFLFAVPAIAVATGSYIHFLVPALSAQMTTWIVLILFIAVNLGEIKHAARIEMVAALMALLGLLGFYGFGLTSHAVPHVSRGYQATSLHSVLQAIPFAIWLYLAIEGGALSAEEVKKPARTIPIGLIAAILTLAVCSLLTIMTTTHLLVGQAALVDYPIPAALAKIPGMSSLSVVIISCLALFGLFASLNGIIMGCSRQMFAMARAGYLPPALSRLSKNKVPYMSVLLTGLISFICVYSNHISAALIEMAVFAAMIMYLGSLIAWFVLQYKGALNHDLYHVPSLWLPVVAIVTCLLCLYAVVRYAIWPGSLFLLHWHCSLLMLLGAIVVLALINYGLSMRKHQPKFSQQN